MAVFAAALEEGGEGGFGFRATLVRFGLQHHGDVSGQACLERRSGVGRPDLEFPERIFAARILALDRQGEGSALGVGGEGFLELVARPIRLAFVAADGPALYIASRLAADRVLYVEALLIEVGLRVVELQRHRLFGIASDGNVGGVESADDEVAGGAKSGAVAGEAFISECLELEAGERGRGFHRNGHGVDDILGRAAGENRSIGLDREGDAALRIGRRGGGFQGSPARPEGSEGEALFPLGDFGWNGCIEISESLRRGGEARFLFAFGLRLEGGGFGLVGGEFGRGFGDGLETGDLASAFHRHPVGLGRGDLGGEDLVIGVDVLHHRNGRVDLGGAGGAGKDAVVDLLDEFAIIGLGRDEVGELAVLRPDRIGDGGP